MLSRAHPLMPLVLLALALSPSLSQVAWSADFPGQAIDEFVQAEMQAQSVPGVAVGIVSHGEVLKAQGYGYANLELMVPVSPVSIFQSGSIGKMFTATAIMLQVEDGKLELSDPLTRFFPDAPASWADITVYQLLTHTSGIPDYAEGLPDYRKDYTEQELAAIAFPRPLDFPPGTRWSYSNTAYDLLGIIVNRVSGKFYGDVLAERVFQPLGMKTTRIISEADIVPNRSDGYRLVDGVVKNQEWVSPSLNTVASGALYFSVEDMIAWDAGVRRRAILTPESWDLILKPAVLNSGETWPYGFGWFLDERAGQPMHRHSGSWQGFKTSYARFIGDDLSIIVLANLDQANPGRILEGIAALIDPALAEPESESIEDAEPQVTEQAPE